MNIATTAKASFGGCIRGHRGEREDLGPHPAQAGTGAGAATLADGRDRALATTDQLGTDVAPRLISQGTMLRATEFLKEAGGWTVRGGGMDRERRLGPKATEIIHFHYYLFGFCNKDGVELGHRGPEFSCAPHFCLQAL